MAELFLGLDKLMLMSKDMGQQIAELFALVGGGPPPLRR